MASRPISCISRLTRLRLTWWPRILSQTVILREPQKGVFRYWRSIRAHQLQVLSTGLSWLVVQGGAADVQQGALAYQGQLQVFSVNHGPALRLAHNPDLRDKKSRSTLSWPICW